MATGENLLAETKGVVVRSDWDSPARIPPLPFEGVQVWRLAWPLRAQADLPNAFYPLLSKDERRRADLIKVAAVREEFVAGRGLLRLLLGAATGVEPARVTIATKPQGKPCLAQAANLEFNVSHSEGMILIALSRATAVGVDVEFVSDEFGEAEQLMDIARESFHAGEFSVIARIPPGRDRLLAFYRAWTRREAVAKADGRGIASLLKYQVFEADEFGEHRVSLAGVAEKAQDSGEVDYFVQTPDPGPHHLAAVASSKPRQALALFDAQRLRS
jgi:4'-phosphopantetheinyl transferase